jgi:hypothetical protein
MRTRSAISLTALVLALALGPSAHAFDPPRPGSGAATLGEVDPPRPPGSIPRARALAPAAIPNPGPLPPMARPAPTPVAPAVAFPAIPVESTPRLGPAEPRLDTPSATGYAPSDSLPSAVAPVEAFRNGSQMLRKGEHEKALRSLESAAERGFVMAQYKLGRMYADGEGVEQSDLRAFEYFSAIADMHADDPPGTPQAGFTARAFVALGHYYVTGIPNSYVKSDIVQARRMYYHAATYFGDAEGQYFYARTLFDGVGGLKDPRRAAQWFYSAANKGQAKAQAMLGRMLFKGEPGVPRQAGRGLMWLWIAKSNAATADGWIGELWDAASKQASEDEKALAAELLLQWRNGQRN